MIPRIYSLPSTNVRGLSQPTAYAPTHRGSEDAVVSVPATSPSQSGLTSSESVVIRFGQLESLAEADSARAPELRMDVLHLRVEEKDAKSKEGEEKPEETKPTDVQTKKQTLSEREAGLLRQLRAMRSRPRAHRYAHLRHAMSGDDTMLRFLTDRPQGGSRELDEVRSIRRAAESPETSPRASALIVDQAVRLTIDVILGLQAEVGAGTEVSEPPEREPMTLSEIKGIDEENLVLLAFLDAA